MTTPWLKYLLEDESPSSTTPKEDITWSLSIEAVEPLTPADWSAIASRGLVFQHSNTALTEYQIDQLTLIREVIDAGTKSKNTSTRWHAWVALHATSPFHALGLLFRTPGECLQWFVGRLPLPNPPILYKASEFWKEDILLEPESLQDLFPLLNSLDKSVRELGFRLMGQLGSREFKGLTEPTPPRAGKAKPRGKATKLT